MRGASANDGNLKIPEIVTFSHEKIITTVLTYCDVTERHNLYSASQIIYRIPGTYTKTL